MGSDNVVPWTWPAWSKLTGVEHAPYTDEAASHPPAGCTTQQCVAIRAFALNYWSKSEQARDIYIKKTHANENDAEGRGAWTTWVQASWTKRWGVNSAINKRLTELDAHPYAIMRRLQLKTVRSTTFLL
jgi:hypothetical protein